MDAERTGDGSGQEGWRSCAYPGTLRRSQSVALDAVERVRRDGHRSAYVVLPPGAG